MKENQKGAWRMGELSDRDIGLTSDEGEGREFG